METSGINPKNRICITYNDTIPTIGKEYDMFNMLISKKFPHILTQRKIYDKMWYGLYCIWHGKLNEITDYKHEIKTIENAKRFLELYKDGKNINVGLFFIDEGKEKKLPVFQSKRFTEEISKFVHKYINCFDFKNISFNTSTQDCVDLCDEMIAGYKSFSLRYHNKNYKIWATSILLHWFQNMGAQLYESQITFSKLFFDILWIFGEHSGHPYEKDIDSIIEEKHLLPSEAMLSEEHTISNGETKYSGINTINSRYKDYYKIEEEYVLVIIRHSNTTHFVFTPNN